jgi:hypothetical protein
MNRPLAHLRHTCPFTLCLLRCQMIRICEDPAGTPGTGMLSSSHARNRTPTAYLWPVPGLPSAPLKSHYVFRRCNGATMPLPSTSLYHRCQHSQRIPSIVLGRKSQDWATLRKGDCPSFVLLLYLEDSAPLRHTTHGCHKTDRRARSDIDHHSTAEPFASACGDG